MKTEVKHFLSTQDHLDLISIELFNTKYEFLKNDLSPEVVFSQFKKERERGYHINNKRKNCFCNINTKLSNKIFEQGSPQFELKVYDNKNGTEDFEFDSEIDAKNFRCMLKNFQLLQKMEYVKNLMFDISKDWTERADEVDLVLEKDYPIESSFDEFVLDFSKWVQTSYKAIGQE